MYILVGHGSVAMHSTQTIVCPQSRSHQAMFILPLFLSIINYQRQSIPITNYQREKKLILILLSTIAKKFLITYSPKKIKTEKEKISRHSPTQNLFFELLPKQEATKRTVFNPVPILGRIDYFFQLWEMLIIIACPQSWSRCNIRTIILTFFNFLIFIISFVCICWLDRVA